MLASYVSTLVFPVSPCVCVGLPKTQCLPHNPWESSGLGKQELLLQNVDAKSLIWHPRFEILNISCIGIGICRMCRCWKVHYFLKRKLGNEGLYPKILKREALWGCDVTSTKRFGTKLDPSWGEAVHCGDTHLTYCIMIQYVRYVESRGGTWYQSVHFIAAKPKWST